VLRVHLPARKLRQVCSFSFGFGSCPGLALLPGLSVRFFDCFEGFDVVVPLVAAEELPFPLPDNAL
jgi:hypothetical protein